MLGHAHGGYHGVQGENQIEHGNLGQHRAVSCHLGGLFLFAVAGEGVMDLLCGFPNEEEAA